MGARREGETSPRCLSYSVVGHGPWPDAGGGAAAARWLGADAWPLSLPGFRRLDGSEVTSGFLFVAQGWPNWKDMSG